MNLKKKSTMFAMTGVLSLSMFSMTVSAETTSGVDTVSSATANTTTDSTTTDSSSTAALLDRHNLTDGLYDFNVTLWHATKDQASMAASVIKSAQLAVSNGVYRVILYTQEMSAMGVTATLDQLAIKQSDGSYVNATKADDKFMFTLPTLDDYLDVNVEYMGHSQAARLKLGWVEESSVDKSELESLITSVQGLDEANYTVESYAALTSALTKAQEVNADKNATADSVNSAVEQLKTAMQALKETTSDVLADGVYQLPVALWNATVDQASMANSALLPTAKLVVKNGEYQLYISTQPMTFGTITASLQTLKYPDAQGNYQLATVEAEKDGNPTQFSFPIYSQDEYILVKVNPEVALMGNQDIDARIKLDWTQLTPYVEEETTNEVVTDTSTSTTNENVISSTSNESSSSIIKNTGANHYSILGMAGLFTLAGAFLSIRKKENV